MCSCGNLHVDGGEAYLKRGYKDPSRVQEIRTEEELREALAKEEK
jgi:hypothetical protein